mmetsp:Transcript_67683/g.178484  ORF Transcript_67683/g.178484 Transcript_67683/m.178484 type:complete len:516 (+) Transcript_67683:372-1919(+)
MQGACDGRESGTTHGLRHTETGVHHPCPRAAPSPSPRHRSPHARACGLPPSSSRVHGGDLRRVLVGDRLALELAHGGHHLVLDRELVVDEDALGGHLELVELALGRRLQVLEHLCCDGRARADLRPRRAVGQAGGLGELAHGGRGADERDAVGHRRLGVHERHRDEAGRLENVLNLGERNVFAVRQLDEVLLAVDDLDRSRRRHLPDVARTKIADAVEGDEILLVLLHDLRVGVRGIDQVALAHGGPSDEDLTAAHADRRVVLVGEEVVALLPVAQTDARRLLRRADAMLEGRREADRRRTARLGEAVALNDGALERGHAKLADLEAQRRGAGADHPHLAAEQLRHRLEDEPEERVGPDDSLVKVGGSVGERRLEPRLDRLGSGVDLAVDGGIDAIEHGRRGEEEGRLERRRVAHLRLLRLQHFDRRRQDRADPTVPDRHAGREAGELDNQLHDVRERQVGEEAAAGGGVGGERGRGRRTTRDRRDQVAMRHLHALRVARRARRVHAHGDGFGRH